jgi:hypothetical protein
MFLRPDRYRNAIVPHASWFASWGGAQQKIDSRVNRIFRASRPSGHICSVQSVIRSGADSTCVFRAPRLWRSSWNRASGSMQLARGALRSARSSPWRRCHVHHRRATEP